MARYKAVVATALVVFMLAGSGGVAYAGTGYASGATLTIVGHGRAHGVGLCMTSVMNMAKAGYKYSYILPYFYRGTRVQTKTNLPRTVRVGVLRRSGAISVTSGIGSYYSVRTSTGSFIWRGGSGKVLSVSYSGGRYYLTMRRSGSVIGRRSTTSPVRVYPGSGTILKITNDGHMYRGKIELRWGRESGAMWAVNIVGLEYYLRGLGEEPESWPFEGLKVLAIVSRGYAAYRSLHPKHAGDGFAICNTGDCQAYVGYNYERVAPRLGRAVALTRNRVVTYAGRLVVTPYFSNSGGQTENIEYVWGGSPMAWLKSVKTPWATGHPAYYWTVPISFRSLTTRLAQSSSTRVPGSLIGFKILSTGISPRVRTMAIVGSSGTKTTTGSMFQENANLQSTWFRFDMPPRITSTSLAPTTFAPDGDGVLERTRFSFTISEAASISYNVYNSRGTRVDSSGSVQRSAGRTYVIWDGKSSSGSTVADGRYRILVTAQDARHNKNYASAWVTVNKLLSFVTAVPTTITPNGDGIDDTATVSYRLERRATVDVHIDTAAGTLVKRLVSGSQDAGAHSVPWGGTDGSGATMPQGTYRYSVIVDDGSFSAARSGNIVVEPAAGALPSAMTISPESDAAVKSLMAKLPGWLVPAGE